jgi:hypothetical protein
VILGRAARNAVGGRAAAALANEFRHGWAVLTGPDLAGGVQRFRGGAGRGGALG